MQFKVDLVLDKGKGKRSVFAADAVTLAQQLM
jgi:hypothetical protein